MLLLLLFFSLYTTTSFAVDGSSSDSVDDSAEDTPNDKDVEDMGVTDVLAILFMACGLAISSAGGIGGGSILMPALVLMVGFDMKRATPISTLAVAGGAIANALFNFRKRHPSADRPLIDSDMAAVIIPVVMGGAVLGAVLTNLLPPYIISLLFVIVLALSGWRAVQKAMQLRRREAAVSDGHEVLLANGIEDSSSGLEAFNEGDETSTPDASYLKSPSVLSPSASYHVAVDHNGSTTTTTDTLGDADAPVKRTIEVENGSDAALAEILARERHISWRRQLSIFVCYLGILIASVGGKLVTCGGGVYWFLLLVEIPWVAVFAIGTARSLNREFRVKQQLGYPFVEGDVCWDDRTSRLLPAGCLLAGVIAGLFGIGGAIVASPLMLELGVVPEVAAATSALMVLYSSGAAMLKYIVLGMVAWDWAMLLFALALVVTSISQVVILGYVRRSGRQSVIVLCVGASILLGAALMAVRAVRAAVEDGDQPFHAHVCG